MRFPLASNRAARVVLALACLYGPYAWLVLMDYPWDSYRWQWVRMWPLLPGMPVHLLPGVHRLPDSLGLVAMGLTTTPLLLLVVLPAWQGRRWLAPVLVVVLLLSAATSWLDYHLFLF
jgi:hypothetical protein